MERPRRAIGTTSQDLGAVCGGERVHGTGPPGDNSYFWGARVAVIYEYIGFILKSFSQFFTAHAH